MSKGRSKVYNDGDLIYYSVTIPHDNTAGAQEQPTPAIFYETRSQPIVNNPSEYRLSVTRMEVPGDCIPIFIMPVQYNPNDPTDINFTYFSITLTKGGTPEQVYLEWTPEDFTAPVPQTAPTPISPPINAQFYQYYSMNTFQTIVNMFNTAFASAFTSIATAYPGITSTKGPIMIFDPETQLFTIYVQQSYQTDAITIYFNTASFQLFQDTLKINLLTYDTNVSGQNAQLIIENTYNNIVNAPTFDISGNYFNFTQEYSNIYTPVWNSLAQIAITSDLPTANQLQPNINIQYNIVQQSQNNFRPILTDFNLIGNYRTGILYNPTAQYRYIQLNSSNPINSVNISCYWVDKFQNYYPIMLCDQNNVNLLILFEKIK